MTWRRSIAIGGVLLLGLFVGIGLRRDVIYDEWGPMFDDRCDGREDFDAARWRADSPALLDPSERTCMVRALQASGVLRGTDSSAVVALLGPVGSVPSGHVGAFSIPLDVNSPVPTDKQGWLIIRLDSARRVSMATVMWQ